MGQVGLEGAFGQLSCCSVVTDAGPRGCGGTPASASRWGPWLALEAVCHLTWGCSEPPLHRGSSSLWARRPAVDSES